MIQARKLGHIVLKVRDAQKSKEFYTRALGLKVASETERGAIFLSFGTQHHDLALFQIATGEPPEAAQPGLHHTAWQLGSFEELQAAHRELGQLGIRVDSVIEHSDEEERWLTTGVSSRQRTLVVWHTDRGDSIRLIGARAATPAERRAYESGE